MVWLGRRQADDGADRHHAYPDGIRAGSFAPHPHRDRQRRAGKRSAAARQRSSSRKGARTGTAWCFRLNLVRLLDRLEEEKSADRVSSESRAWLAQCGLTVEQLVRQVEPEYTPARKVHFYHCDHRGLPLALISEDGKYGGAGNMMNGANQLNEGRTRITCTSRTVRPQQYGMRESGCTITVTGTTIRCRGGILPRT